MEIFGETIDRELPDLARQGVRTRFIGRRDRAPDGCARRWRASRTRPPATTGSSSGSRSTTAAAPRSSRPRGASSRPASSRGVDENRCAAHLYAPDMPDPDLVIRTSGELRVSNFLLWQLAYAELVFVDRLWPDFGSRELQDALAAYARRRRRFGGASERQFWSRILVAVVGLPSCSARLARRLVAVRARRGGRGARAARVLHDHPAAARRSCRPATPARRSRCSAPSSAARTGARRLARRRCRSRSCSRALADAAVGHRRDRDDRARRGLDRDRARPRHAHPRADPASTPSSRSSRSCSPCSRATRPRTSSGGSSAGTSWRRALAGEDVGGLRRRRVAPCSSRSSRSTSRDFLPVWQALVLGGVIALAAPPATSSSRRSSGTCR